MGILISEHRWVSLSVVEDESIDTKDKYKITKDVFEKLCNHDVRIFKIERGQKIYPYRKIIGNNEVHIEGDYYIGVDWLIPGNRYVHVEPKINTALSGYFRRQAELDSTDIDRADRIEDEARKEIETVGRIDPQVNYLDMLINMMSDYEVSKECVDLVLIDWDAPAIPINQHIDRLTPFLIIQFLQLLRHIVRKGLKRAYYTVKQNLANKIKGKILVGQHLRQNVFKNRFTTTSCEYQIFGNDIPENQFLKKVMKFASSYIENNPTLFPQNDKIIIQLINYLRPAFDKIGDFEEGDRIRSFTHSPFFSEYKEAVRIGDFILKRFSYNISKTTNKSIETPPFWIDMPRLFELYVYSQIIKANPKERNKILYQFSTYGNFLDILITKPGYQYIIDAKYKLHYNHMVIHSDIRQVAGYARLKEVRGKLGLLDKDDSSIDCLIIYPDLAGVDNFTLENIRSKIKEISAYHKVWKLNVKIPCIGIQYQQ